MLALQITNYSEAPDKLELKNKLALLLEYVNFLRDNNVNVYFFEMPIHSRLMDLSRATIIRKEIQNKFNISKVNIFNIDSSSYHTTDGLHLDNTEALNYTLFFKKEFGKHN